MRRTLLPVTAAAALALGALAPTAGAGEARDPSGFSFLGDLPAAKALIKAGTQGRLAVSSKAAAEPSYHVVVRGLDNPRQMTFGPRGWLYVAEAGHGASDPSGCVGEGDDRFCVGMTAKVSRIVNPRIAGSSAVTIANNLPSGAGPDGSFAVGAHGVGLTGPGRVRIAVGDVPEFSPGALEGKATALLRATTDKGVAVRVADLLAYELATNPDGQLQFGDDGNPVDALSNPYATVGFGRGRALVADAGGNAILSVLDTGQVSTFAVPPVVTTGECEGRPNNDPEHAGCDPVPTGIAKGPDGHVYVSGLVSEVPGEGRVWKFDGQTGALLEEWSGFESAHGLGVGRDGSIYVAELLAGFDPENPNPPEIGKVTKVAPDGMRTSVQVPLPGGIAVRGDEVYASSYAVGPATGLFGNPEWTGQVVRLHF